MKPLCNNCKYWRHINGHSWGECHRYAPREVECDPIIGIATPSKWPVTRDNDFCGQHSARAPRSRQTERETT